ncbi:hypothetical protein SUGI_1083800 [Cryptomeria japonica]|nr:hypothetical protein SUGI_1083800 [Cryptomeria japonica]
MFLIFRYLYKKNFKQTIRNPGMSEEYANRWIHQLKQLNLHTTMARLKIFSNDTNRNIAQGKCASCMLYYLFAEERRDEDRGQYANFPMPMRHSAIWIMQTTYPKISNRGRKAVHLPPAFGWVVLSALAYIFLNFLMAIQVGKARKSYNVPYPTLYAIESENKDAKKFNCIQRGHQNSLEMMPVFFLLLILGSLQYPVVSSILGVFHCLA